MIEKIYGQAKKLAVRLEVIGLIALLGLVAILCVIQNVASGIYDGLREKTDADFMETAKIGWQVFKRGSRA